MKKHFRFPILLVVVLFMAGCSTDDSQNYLGGKILASVGDDPSVTPSPEIIKNIFPACTFKEVPMTNEWEAEGCLVENFSKTNKVEPNENKFTVRTLQSRSMLHELEILPAGMNYGYGSWLFDGLPDVKVEKIECPKLSEDGLNTDAYAIRKKGKAILTMVEQNTFGSAGSTAFTTLYFGRPACNCEAVLSLVAETEKRKKSAREIVKQSSLKSGYVHDTDTGVKLDGESAAANNGACFAAINYISAKWPKSFKEDYVDRYTDIQKGWIGDQVRLQQKWRDVVEAPGSSKNLFKLFKSGVVTRDEAEWNVGFLTLTAGLNNPAKDLAPAKLIYMDVCGKAGLISKI